MAEKYPKIAIRIHTAGSNQVPAALLAGDADLGLAFSLPAQPELRRVASGRFRLGAVMRPDHPLARHRELTIAACTPHRLILPSPEISIFTLLETQLRRFRGRLDVRAEVSSLQLMRTLTIGLNAISFQSRIGLEEDLASNLLVHIPLQGAHTPTTELGAFVRAGRPLPAALEIFLARTTQEITSREAKDAEN